MGYKLELMNVQKKMDETVLEYKLKSVTKLTILNDNHLSEARYIGIAEWNGFINNSKKQNTDKIRQFYQHLISSFRRWRIESLKTLMDIMGFFVVSKLQNVDKIALSYNKDKVIYALSNFFMYPTN